MIIGLTSVLRKIGWLRVIKMPLFDIKTLLPGSRYRNDKDGTTSSVVNARQEEMSPDYEKKAAKLDSHVPGDDNTPFQDKLKTFRVNGPALGPTVGA